MYNAGAYYYVLHTDLYYYAGPTAGPTNNYYCYTNYSILHTTDHYLHHSLTTTPATDVLIRPTAAETTYNS